MSTLLREYIDGLVLEGLRNKFDIRHFMALSDPEQIWDYVEKAGLTQLGAGTGRTVYLLSSGKVLKLARNYDGQDQIKDEWEGFQHFGRSGMVTQAFAVDPEYWWIIMETVRGFQSDGQLFAETGVNDDLIVALAEQMSGEAPTKKGFQNFLARTKAEWKKFPPERKIFGMRLAMLAGAKPAGMELLFKLYILTVKYMVDDIARWDHWGKTADGRIVCLDYGLPAKSN